MFCSFIAIECNCICCIMVSIIWYRCYRDRVICICCISTTSCCTTVIYCYSFTSCIFNCITRYGYFIRCISSTVCIASLWIYFCDIRIISSIGCFFYFFSRRSTTCRQTRQVDLSNYILSVIFNSFTFTIYICHSNSLISCYCVCTWFDMCICIACNFLNIANISSIRISVTTRFKVSNVITTNIDIATSNAYCRCIICATWVAVKSDGGVTIRNRVNIFQRFS